MSVKDILLANTDKTAAEISELAGCSTPYVYYLAKKSGIKLNRPNKWRGGVYSAAFQRYNGIQNKSYGARSELIVCADLLARGAQVYRSVNHVGIDLLALTESEIIKIEVRSGTRRADGSLGYSTIPKASIGGPHDILAVVLPDGEIRYSGNKVSTINNLPMDTRISGSYKNTKNKDETV